MSHIVSTTVYPMNIDRPGNLVFENHPNGGILITDAQGESYRVNHDDLCLAVEAVYLADVRNRERKR